MSSVRLPAVGTPVPMVPARPRWVADLGSGSARVWALAGILQHVLRALLVLVLTGAALGGAVGYGLAWLVSTAVAFVGA